jgi:DNA polymerase I
MNPQIDIAHAVQRGRYMAAAAHIEHTGVPIDVELLHELLSRWSDIQERLIAEIDSHYGVFEGTTFKAEKWKGWLIDNGIPWPRLATGSLALDDDTFREMARVHPKVSPMRELRVSLSQMRLLDLSVGSDGRNRVMLSAFRARTGRNQPSNSRFIFGPAVWLRGLIKPEPVSALAYIDWSQQEFGIAAALSKDENMIQAYLSGDPYLAFAIQAGAVPDDATKQSHAAVREQFKACVLAVQYGMGADALALRIGQTASQARELLRKHSETYRAFWKWSDAAVDHAWLRLYLNTVFGWNVRVGANTNSRALRNFPMQANGAEMLRHGCCIAIERGVQICAPIHDAILIEAEVGDLERSIAVAQEAMADASSLVLDGFRLRSDAKRIIYPERYQDARGELMWNTVMKLLER